MVYLQHASRVGHPETVGFVPVSFLYPSYLFSSEGNYPPHENASKTKISNSTATKTEKSKKGPSGDQGEGGS